MYICTLTYSHQTLVPPSNWDIWSLRYRFLLLFLLLLRSLLGRYYGDNASVSSWQSICASLCYRLLLRLITRRHITTCGMGTPRYNVLLCSSLRHHLRYADSMLRGVLYNEDALGVMWSRRSMKLFRGCWTSFWDLCLWEFVVFHVSYWFICVIWSIDDLLCVCVFTAICFLVYKLRANETIWA